MEVIHLLVYDLDAERGTLMVRQGKGKKDRMVPHRRAGDRVDGQVLNRPKAASATNAGGEMGVANIPSLGCR